MDLAQKTEAELPQEEGGRVAWRQRRSSEKRNPSSITAMTGNALGGVTLAEIRHVLLSRPLSPVPHPALHRSLDDSRRAAGYIAAAIFSGRKRTARTPDISEWKAGHNSASFAESDLMELYQLRAFVAVAEEGILSRAAERLSASQPAISAQIRALEEEFGLKLFERSPAGMTLTPAGETLWESAERTLRAAQDLTACAAALQQRIAGRLRLGLNKDGAALRSPELLGSLASRYPDLTFETLNGTSGTLLKRLLGRELDATFHEGLCEDPEIDSLFLSDQELVIVIPHAWASDVAQADWKRLAAMPWIFTSPSCSYHRYIEQFARERGLQLQKRFQLDDDATGLRLIADHAAITMTTRDALRHSGLDRSGEIEVWPHFREVLPISLCTLASRRDDPVIRVLRETVGAMWSRPPLAIA